MIKMFKFLFKFFTVTAVAFVIVSYLFGGLGKSIPMPAMPSMKNIDGKAVIAKCEVFIKQANSNINEKIHEYATKKKIE